MSITSNNKLLFWGVAATTGIAVAAALYHATKSTYESMVPLKVSKPHLAVFHQLIHKMIAGAHDMHKQSPPTSISTFWFASTVSVQTRDHQWLDGKRSDPLLPEQEKWVGKKWAMT